VVAAIGQSVLFSFYIYLIGYIVLRVKQLAEKRQPERVSVASKKVETY